MTTMETDRQVFARNVADHLARAQEGAVIALVLVQPDGSTGGSLSCLGSAEPSMHRASLLGLLAEEVVLLVRGATAAGGEDAH